MPFWKKRISIKRKNNKDFLCAHAVFLNVLLVSDVLALEGPGMEGHGFRQLCPQASDGALFFDAAVVLIWVWLVLR